MFVGVLGATDGCAACQGGSQVRVQGCRERFEDIFDRKKQPGQPRAVVQPEELGRVAYHLTCLRMWNKNLNKNNVRQSLNPLQSHHSHAVRATKIRCKSAQRLAVQESQKMMMTREQSAHAWT